MRVAWHPLPGSQAAFVASHAFETLYEGTRGPGKTAGLLMSYAQHVGKGYGAAWRGIIFRQTYKQLDDIIAKSKALFKEVYGDAADFNSSSSTWTWPASGEQLLLRRMAHPDDYWDYHGHEYPFLGFEELTTWATPECFLRMQSCVRSSFPGIPKMVRGTTNPYGAGHNWVKRRYRLPGMRFQMWEPVDEKTGRPLPSRLAIHGHLRENTILLAAQPDYAQVIAGSARNDAERAAWLDGSWDIVAGGMFDDVWDPRVHLVDDFPVPRAWRIDRSFDWGSTSPFSVGWWAQSNGEDVELPSGKALATRRGDLFRIGEWYGAKRDADNEGLRMLAVDIARGIRQREMAMGIHGRVRPGPADSSIFNEENGNCIARDMERAGVRWEKANKGPGSRKNGWEVMRRMLGEAARPGRDQPGMFAFRRACPEFARLLPTMPRKEDDPDDIDTDSEDHIADEARYRATHGGGGKGMVRVAR